MKSFEQLAEAAYNAWHRAAGTDPANVWPFKQLDANVKNKWIAAAQAVADEISTVF